MSRFNFSLTFLTAFWKVLLTFLLFSGCVIDPPQGEYSLARAALEAAQEADAAKYSPGYWHRAKSTYRQAEKYYSNKEHELAKQYFKRARLYAERAENASQLKRAKGEDGY